MNQWSFVVAAHAITAIAVLGLIGASFIAMRRAEAAADAVKRRR